MHATTARNPNASRREVFGYCMYDFANSSYTTLISTVAFSKFFRIAVVGGDSNVGDLYWSLAAAAAHVVLIVISPFLGAFADSSGRKKRFLFWTTVQTVVACSLLATVTPGALGWAFLVYVVATIGFEAGYIFYNAFLIDISTPATVGRISAWSWGTGFVGGLLALVACAPFLRHPLESAPGVLDPAAVGQWRISFVVVAAFFAVFAVPTFLYLKDRPRTATPVHGRAVLSAGWERVRGTLTHLRRYRGAGLYVLGYLFFYGGIETVIKFAAIYATVTFAIPEGELILLFMATNVIAVPGTLLAGYLADWIGAKAALAWTLVGWIALLLWGATAQTKVAFWILAGGIAIGMGATQSIGRALMSQLSPPERLSEFFGYNLTAGRFGSVLSLVLFGLVSSGTGDQRLAVLWLVPAFVVGLGIVLAIRPGPAESAPSSNM